jgi:hypothetical protein
MRRQAIVLIALLAAGTIIPETASAQLSPRGVLNAVTMPFRSMLGHLRHGPIRHRPTRDAASAPRAATLARYQSKLGLVGPLVWAGAYEDVIGYTFWPDDYGKQYRQHGFGDLVTTIVDPLDDLPPIPTVEAAAETTGTADAATSDVCKEGMAARTDWPAAQLKQTAQLSDWQHNALNKFQATVVDAVKTIKAGCRDITTLTPIKRVEALEQQIWAVQNAGVLIRASLKDFYDTLTDEQKAKFSAPAADDQRGAGKTASAPMGRQYQACAAQGANDPERLIKRIQQTVRPMPQQRARLEALGKTAGQMQQLLMASCGQPVPDNPLARLDSADNRLTTMNYAATSMEVALIGFYNGLTSEQKARFDSLGR